VTSLGDPADVPGKPEPSDYRLMEALKRLGRAEILLRVSGKLPNSLVRCTPPAEQVCCSAPMADLLGPLAWRLNRLSG